MKKNLNKFIVEMNNSVTSNFKVTNASINQDVAKIEIEYQPVYPVESITWSFTVDGCHNCEHFTVEKICAIGCSSSTSIIMSVPSCEMWEKRKLPFERVAKRYEDKETM